jgi:hypothetical protein
VDAQGRVVAFGCGSLLALAGCSPPLTAPVISNLRLMPGANVHPGDALTVMVDFIDDDEDLTGGKVEVGLLLAGQLEGDLFGAGLAGSTSSNHGTIKTTVTLPSRTTPGHYQMSITLIDHAHLRSNPIVLDLDVAP